MEFNEYPRPGGTRFTEEDEKNFKSVYLYSCAAEQLEYFLSDHYTRVRIPQRLFCQCIPINIGLGRGSRGREPVENV